MMKNNQKTCPELVQGYVIGVDGGGTKTVAALADLNGKILAIGKSGPASPRNVGIKASVKNVSEAIKKVLKKIGKNEKILSSFIGLPAVEEEFKFQKEEIKKELLKHKEISPIFKGKVIIGSDQITAFRSSTNKKDGVVLISGTGCVAHGWRAEKEVKTSGWGYLSELGSAFWVGQRGLQAIWKDLDGRGAKTLITKLIFRNWKIKTKENLIEKIYSKKPIKIIPLLSILVNEAGKKGDKIARDILTEVGGELALATNTAIRKLNFQKKKFPLVLVGGMFKSKIVLGTVKKEIKKFAKNSVFIRPTKEPVIGAVKLAIEQISPKE